MKLIQVDFKYDGPFGTENARRLDEMAHSIAQEPGFLWKIWTEDAKAREAGGVYLFSDEASAQHYVEKHTRRLEDSGVTDIRVKFFDVNEELSAITRGPV